MGTFQTPYSDYAPNSVGAPQSANWSGTGLYQHQPGASRLAEDPERPVHRFLGEFMNIETPSREDFAALLDETFGSESQQEGSVIKGTVIGFEKDLAVIDVGLKVEGRVPVREFGHQGKTGGRSV